MKCERTRDQPQSSLTVDCSWVFVSLLQTTIINYKSILELELRTRVRSKPQNPQRCSSPHPSIPPLPPSIPLVWCKIYLRQCQRFYVIISTMVWMLHSSHTLPLIISLVFARNVGALRLFSSEMGKVERLMEKFGKSLFRKGSEEFLATNYRSLFLLPGLSSLIHN